jgi:hypothetical protein
MEYRKALVRARHSERDERFRIHRDEGQAAVLEAIGEPGVTGRIDVAFKRHAEPAI